MDNPMTVVSHIFIKVNDQQISDDIQSRVVEVVVDQHAYLPGMFTLRVYDSDLSLLDNGPFNLVARVEISSRPSGGEPVTLIKGEITSLEPHFGEGMVAELVVRGYDLFHRLYREIKSKTYLNVKDSDLANQFAAAYGLKTDIETTPTVYDHLYQHNQSDLQFLMQRAWRIGYECFVDSNKLVFRRPSTQKPGLTLAWGTELLSFSPRMTLAEQVENVIVKGWDVQTKSAIIGQADQGRLYPQIDEIANDQRDGKNWSQTVSKGSKLVIVNQPVVSQAEAQILAEARLDEISGVFVEAEGTAFRRPDVRAGQTVKLTGLGKRFSGAYLVTSANHVYTSGGFKTNFTVSGTRLGLLSQQVTQHTARDRWLGVAPAIVTNTDDPNGWGRVKLKYPWMSDSEESDWARVLGMGAGAAAGFASIPAVDDEVLVTFVHGDFGSPIVLGGLWNGKDTLPPPVDNAAEGEKPQVRTWYTPKGHHITLYDNADNKMEIVTAGGLSIILNDAGAEITVHSGGKVILQSDGDMQLEAGGNLQIKAGANLDLQATANLNAQATGPVAIKGALVTLN
ncbi:MAG: VgrG-related protein [Chloroflexi bacterium]|nr:VgrG-related protein [Chloroflexota bacterium]